MPSPDDFQTQKYDDQPALHLLDWSLKQLQGAQSPLNRDRLRDLLIGPIAADLSPLELTLSIVESRQQAGVTYTELSLDIGGLMQTLGTLATPDIVRAGAPIFICLHGHHQPGFLAGRQWAIRQGPAPALLEAGIPCFAPDLPGLAEPHHHEGEDTARIQAAYEQLIHNAYLLGWNLNGLRLWVVEQWMNLLRAADDGIAGFASAGFSLGGELSLYLGALHAEIEPVYVSHYAAAWDDSYWAKPHCHCGIIPGLLRETTLADVYGLIAPRRLVLEVGEQDDVFPWEATRQLIAQVRATYQAASAEDNLHVTVKSGGHEYGLEETTLASLLGDDRASIL